MTASQKVMPKERPRAHAAPFQPGPDHCACCARVGIERRGRLHPPSRVALCEPCFRDPNQEFEDCHHGLG